MEFRIAVKSFIVHDGKLLVLERRKTDKHKPGAWDLPGGRLSQGESPFLGLKRETLEETGLDIEIHNPLKVHHFTREDGQQITMLVFVCSTQSTAVQLSEEHTAFEWIALHDAKRLLVSDFWGDLETYLAVFSKEK